MRTVFNQPRMNDDHLDNLIEAGNYKQFCQEVLMEIKQFRMKKSLRLVKDIDKLIILSVIVVCCGAGIVVLSFLARLANLFL